MDYDDNDYHCQNQQLAGEEFSKFSPVLNPYVLPKFDFGENLQGHIKFDSVVENEVYLGIPIEEGNQWIEDYSRGSSGTESCSIPRHSNNVWSEATSSESVEMLLKSVSQGEMVPVETIIEVSESNDELGSLTKRSEPNSNQQIAEIAISAHESSREMDPDAVGEKIELVVPKENLICDNSNQRDVGDTSANISPNNKICSMDSPPQNVISKAGELRNEENEHGLVKSTCEGVDTHNVPSQQVQMNEQLLTTVAHQERKLDLPIHMKLSSDSCKLEPEVVESSSSVEVIEGNIPIAHGSESNTITTATMNRPSLDVVVGGTNLTSCDEAVVSVSVRGPTSGVDSNEKEAPPVPNVGSTHLDINEEVRIEVPANTSLLLKESSQAASDDAGCVSKVVTVDQSVSEVPHEVGQEFSEMLESCRVICDPAIIESDRVEAIASKKHKEAAVERNHQVSTFEVTEVLKEREVVTGPMIASLVAVPHSDMDQQNCPDNKTIVASGVNCPDQAVPNTKVNTSNDHLSEPNADHMLEDGAKSADSCKGTCDSPTVISSIDPPYSEAHKQDETKGAIIEKVSLSEATGGVQSISPHLRGNDSSKECNFTFEVNPLVGVPVGEIGKCWQSFPPIQGCKTSMTVEKSPSTSGAGQMDTIVKQISRSPQACDMGIPHGGAKVNPGNNSGRGSGKAARRENPKKGNRVKDKTHVGQLEREDKSCGVISLPTSNMPDLNTSVSPSAIFKQSLTNIQQVQLGAQIFVYGSLIQGAAPSEDCMVSAFGPSDDTRIIWEPVWRACLERLHGRKAHANNCGSPTPTRSGSIPLDQAIKHDSLASSVFSSPAPRARSKGTPSAVINSITPLSSPPWNIPTPPCDSFLSGGVSRSPILNYHQSLSPLHPYQNLIGHNISWLSQGSFPGPWVASPQTSDIGVRVSGFPFTDPVKLSPVKESSMHLSSTSKHKCLIPAAKSGPPNVSVVTTSILDNKKAETPSGQRSADPKARKRKKASVSGIESLSDYVGSHLARKVPVTVSKIPMLAQSRTVMASAPASHFSTSVAVTTESCSASKIAKFPFALPSTCSSYNPHREEHNVENKVILSKETSNKVEETELDANAAGTHAAAAVSHCQDVWSQMTKQKNSGLVLELEAKLASMNAIIAASAAVAKAAAAAAKSALDAVVQAKLMAGEALVSSETGNPIPSTVKANGSSSSSLIISTAREAARRRVEAASAASKHAENLDAIVKAAELAAEAVSQAGNIVAMGDPFPSGKLVESSPEGYGKLLCKPSEQGVKLNSVGIDQSNTNSIEEVPYGSAKKLDGEPSLMERFATNHDVPPLPREISSTRVVDGISNSSSEHISGEKKCHKGSVHVPESVFDSSSTFVNAENMCENETGSWKKNIKVGCHVEVRGDGNKKAAWFSANILDLMEGKAFVCYSELRSDEGPGQFTEWVPLEDKSSKGPRIRIPHPMIAMGFKGKKKRQRGAMSDYAWSIGDRVDAWMQNCWHEGVVTEKMDETSFTVHFQDQGETSVVRAWHLRPTLVWKEGKWTEWSSSRGGRSSQEDTPKGKWVNHDIPVVGKNTRVDENNVGAVEIMRSKKTKEGLGVIFGVPKPGKKTKLREVGKHFVSERGSENKSVYGMISQGSRGWKNSSKIDVEDKQSVKPEAKLVKRGRISKKNHLSTNSVPNDDTATDDTVNDENKPAHQKSMGYRISSNTSEAAQGPILYSSLALPSNASKKIPSSMAKSERLNKGKGTLDGGKSTKVEGVDKSVPEGVEPRRSIRRFQPTSKLLEGLQSSLKLPVVSHDKSRIGQDSATSAGGIDHG